MNINSPALILFVVFGHAGHVWAQSLLGSESAFAVLAATTVTNTGGTELQGDLGVYPGTAITGFFGTNENDGPGTFTGTSYQGGAVAQQAQADALNTYNQLTDLTYTQDLTGLDLGTRTLSAGVYHFDSAAQLTGILTLDGPGLYVFQIGTTLTTAANSSIVLLNDANPYTDIFWRIGTSSTFGANTAFSGTLIADESHTLGTGTLVEGRVIALNGAVTLDNNIIAIPELGTLWLMGLVGLSLLVVRRFRTGENPPNKVTRATAP